MKVECVTNEWTLLRKARPLVDERNLPKKGGVYEVIGEAFAYRMTYGSQHRFRSQYEKIQMYYLKGFPWGVVFKAANFKVIE